jgi:hypothetical protein
MSAPTDFEPSIKCASDRVVATRNSILWVLRDALSHGTNVSLSELCGRIDLVIGDAQHEHACDILSEIRPWDE